MVLNHSRIIDMQITKVLENEVGVQFDRVKDNTGSTGAAPINSVITGSFKRGRTDKQMQITQSNIKAVLGYEPDNPDYVAVQDALNTGIPYVNVMRVKGIYCTATKLVIPSSTWKWNSDKGLVLTYEHWIDGKLDKTNEIKLGSSDCSNYHDEKNGFTAEQCLLNAIFFHSGVDFYRQHDMDRYCYGGSGVNTHNNYFASNVNLNMIPFPDGNLFLHGFSSDFITNMPSQYQSHYNHWESLSSEIRFIANRNPPEGYSDLVTELWGESVSLFSCMTGSSKEY